MKGLVALAAGCALLAGCGSSGTPSSAPSPTVSAPTTDGNGEAVPELPDLSTLPTPGTSRSPAKPPSSRPTRVLGADISWPQCPKGMGIPLKRSHGSPMPTAAAEFVIIGLTNGPSFFANPCLADQVSWVGSRHLRAAAYAVVSYPDDGTLRRYADQGPYAGSDRLGALSNVGYSAGLFNLASMKSAGLVSPTIWIDVEPVPNFAWSNDPAANAAVVVGSARAYTEAGYQVGYYSTPALWKRVVGDLRTEAPEWRAAGQTSMAEALSRCGPDWSFGGGTAVLGQWVEAGRDRNVTCPDDPLGIVGTPERWFHQY